MEIPPRLLRSLEQDRSLHAAVLRAFTDFEPLLKHSHLPFFPEYTDHGPDHIQGVLRTAAAIIRDEADPVLTPGDAGVLVLAILLHDIALHLSEDGFLRLIDPAEPQPSPLLPEDRPWPRLWEEYLGIARRFDARQLRELFGETDPVSRPGLDPLRWTLRDRLLIGDFLRRHHHRLAHEIALQGFPGPNPLRLDLPEEIADLAGLVARSHGMALRETFPYLEKNYALRQYQGVHAVFLMVVLRIADYLQVEADRAPKQLLRVRRLQSPFSLGKWKEHHAIRDIRTTEPDPEAIFVHARPEDVFGYLALKDLLKGLQKELDLSWAVLGEVYGRWEELKPLGLTSRRVLSNLDDEARFAQLVDYIPRRAAFEAASGDLIPVLVEPLYGDRPDIGVRELLQNAVDAVRELREWKRETAPASPRRGADVLVFVEPGPEGEKWLTVEDRGIGMTPDVVVGYFLKVGASFRRSDAWRKAYEDQEGRSRVLRSGRFGVGALAAFLLGEEIEVSTRHVDASEGISFRAALDTEAIELRKCQRDVGTTVRVRLRPGAERAAESVSWYRLADPSVAWDDRLADRSFLPGPGEPLPPAWRRLLHPDYQDIQWTFGDAPALTCNGIVVQEYRLIDPTWLWRGPWGNRLLMPKLSVFDPDGRLPLNLSRTDLRGKELPFQEQLLEEVVRDLTAWALIKAPEDYDQVAASWLDDRVYPGLRDPYGYDLSKTEHLWFYARTGTGLLTFWNLEQEEIRTLAMIPCSPETGWVSPAGRFCFDLGLPIVRRRLGPGTGRTDAWIRSLLDWDRQNGPQPKGCRVVLGRTWSNRWLNGSARLRKRHLAKIRIEWEHPYWIVWAYGECPKSRIDVPALLSENEALVPLLMAEAYWDAPEDEPVASKIDQVWHGLLGRATIPYAMEERQRVLAYTFRELEPYLEAHRLSDEEESGEEDA